MVMMDGEAKAIASILRTLNNLRPSARQRVMEYVRSRISEDTPSEDMPRVLGGITKECTEAMDLEGQSCFEFS